MLASYLKRAVPRPTNRLITGDSHARGWAAKAQSRFAIVRRPANTRSAPAISETPPQKSCWTFVAMNTRPEYLAALCDLGYREQEARFLCLTATHSGYFTRRQFLRFTHQTKGCLVHRFTTKLMAQNHARATQYGKKTYVFKLTSRKIYDAIGKQNLRDHRSHTADFIRSRLLILDFILAHSEHQYLETEVEKFTFFREQIPVLPSVLPGQTSGPEDLDPTLKRYCTGRFPIFLSPSNDGESTCPVPTFVYAHSANHGLAWFVSYLERNKIFLRLFAAFNLIYASPSRWNLDRAPQVFTSVFRDADHPDPKNLTAYFQIRRLWETGKTGSLTRADRDLLRDGDKRYRVEPLESAYQKWFAAGLPELDLEALLGPSVVRQEVGFHTYLLPENHDFLCCQNARRVRLSLKNARSTSRSV